MGIYGLEKTTKRENEKEVIIDVREVKSSYILSIYKNNIKLKHKLCKSKFINAPYQCICNYMKKDFIVNSFENIYVSIYRVLANGKKENIFNVNNSDIQHVISEIDFINSIQSNIKSEIKISKETNQEEIIDITIIKNKTEYKISHTKSTQYIRVSENRFRRIPYKCIMQSLYKLGINLNSYKVKFNDIELFEVINDSINEIIEEPKVLSMIPLCVRVNNIINSNDIDSIDDEIIDDYKPKSIDSDELEGFNPYTSYLKDIKYDERKQAFINNIDNDDNESFKPINNIILPLKNLDAEYLKLLIEEYDKKERTISINDFYMSDEFQNKINEIIDIINRFAFPHHNFNLNPLKPLNQF